MNDPTPAYLTPYVLSGTLVVVAAILVGLPKALQRAAWSTHDRRRASITGAVLLLTWLLAAFIPARLGFYRASSSRIPLIQCGILLPIVAGVALFWLSSSVRRVFEAIPQQWLVSLQLFRAEGVIFLVLYAGGHLPGIFAWPAGVGDVLVGLFAPIVAARYALNSPHATARLRAWNLFGILDLVVAVTAGFLTSPSPFQLFSLAAPNQLITAFPLVMIPVFAVPLAVLLHLASLNKLAMGGQV
jgi:hypothetical protein